MNFYLLNRGTKTIRIALVLAYLTIFGVSMADAETTSAAIDRVGTEYESGLLDSVEKLYQGQLESALQMADQHVKKFPKSQVGHLIRADVLQAMSPVASQRGPVSAQHSKDLTGLKHQIKSRWLHRQVRQKTSDRLVPANLIMMGAHKYVLVADLQSNRLYLYANLNGKANLIRDYYLSVGKAGYGKQVEGDNKTPVGVYAINKHIPGAKLPDLYGKGAFPIDYPNHYDKSLSRTGYGIWLHGTPSDTYARAPWSSEGCFVLSNDDLLDIEHYLDVDARPPVILSDSIEWVSRTELETRKKEYLQVLRKWKRDWQALDLEAYINLYSRAKLNFGSAEYKRWAKRKNDNNNAKPLIKINLVIDSLFVYPGEDDMFIVKFKERYFGEDFVTESDKVQYWQQGLQGQWKIILEVSP